MTRKPTNSLINHVGRFPNDLRHSHHIESQGDRHPRNRWRLAGNWRRGRLTVLTSTDKRGNKMTYEKANESLVGGFMADKKRALRLGKTLDAAEEAYGLADWAERTLRAKVVCTEKESAVIAALYRAKIELNAAERLLLELWREATSACKPPMQSHKRLS